MYEEDRNRALEMYNEIFDEVNNETAVLQLLVSPTRQAVNLARAYDARERKYQSDDGEEPAYQLVIEDNGKCSSPIKETGIGLKNMQDRVSSVGGQISFSPSENGFRIFASVPKEKL